MDFAIRTISFAISMRIRSPQVQRREGPDTGGWGSYEGEGEGDQSQKANLGQTGQRCTLPHPTVTPYLQGIPSREDIRALLSYTQACTDLGSGSEASLPSCAASGE